MLSSFVSSVSIGETGLFHYIMFVNTVKQNVNTVEECVNKAENDMGSFSGLKKMLSSFVSPVSIGETGLFHYIMFVNTVKQNVNTVEECVNKAENDMGSFSGLKMMLSSFVSPVSIGETGLFHYIMFVNKVKQNVNTVGECVNKAENDMGSFSGPSKRCCLLLLVQ